ncbi:MAG: hypothetical protein LQ341_006378, partial [Variospora aurantia]
FNMRRSSLQDHEPSPASDQGNGKLERASSQLSARSHKPGTIRTRSRKQSLVTPSSAKSLVSFPSLSPDNSPSTTGEGKFKSGPKSSKPHTPFKSGPNTPSIVDALVRKTSTFKGRPALFQDSPQATGKHVPGALHHASDEHLQHLIARNGAIAMVRQLAEDLADRDAEVTVLRRRAEERERELKRMLREVEVSNLDIETRLHRLDNIGDDEATGIVRQAHPPGPSRNATRDRLADIPNGIDQMMGEAMKDDVGFNTETDEGFPSASQKQDKQATIKPSGLTPRDAERRSMTSSIESHDSSKGTVRNWKDYLWSGGGTSRKTSRASSVYTETTDQITAGKRARGNSGANNRRNFLHEDFFSPPERASTSQSRLETAEADEVRSHKSSSSMASWTMKLFAGNPQAQRTVRGRSSTTGSAIERTSRAPSTASAQTANSAMASLMKVDTTDPSTRTIRSKKSIPPLSLGTNSNFKSTPQAPGPQNPVSPKASGDVSNLGPVEMDTILPLDTRPPTQTQLNNKNLGNDLLTDRFGFIYDQRRKRKETSLPTPPKNKHKKSGSNTGLEMLTNPRDPLKSKVNGEESQSIKSDSILDPATPVSRDGRSEDKPNKRWQDFLKVATFPTELLSHTPTSKPISTVIEGDQPIPLARKPTFGDSRGSLPSISLNPEPSTSAVTADNAEIAKPSGGSPYQTSRTANDAEPVKLLLNQLTELHDSLQRERTTKWNEFLRKIRAERKKEGGTSIANDSRSKASMPEIALSDGELIGVAGLGNKGKVGRAKWQEFKHLVLAGIPVAYRAKIWAECSGASALRVPGYYDDLVNDSSNNEKDDPTIITQIEMDIHRTLTDNVFFRKGPGVSKLKEVLVAYSRRNPEVGYCQGMNLITASLLLIMPTAEDAFWILTSIIEKILPEQYYDRSLLASRADQRVLQSYIAEILPRLHAYFDALGIELEALTFQWFLSLFTDCLSAEALYRVWDVVFCFNDGSTFLFQVALALLKLNEGDLLALDSPGAVYGYIGGEMTDHAISIDGLVGASEGLRGV